MLSSFFSSQHLTGRSATRREQLLGALLAKAPRFLLARARAPSWRLASKDPKAASSAKQRSASTWAAKTRQQQGSRPQATASSWEPRRARAFGLDGLGTWRGRESGRNCAKSGEPTFLRRLKLQNANLELLQPARVDGEQRPCKMLKSSGSRVGSQGGAFLCARQTAASGRQECVAQPAASLPLLRGGRRSQGRRSVDQEGPGILDGMKLFAPSGSPKKTRERRRRVVGKVTRQWGRGSERGLEPRMEKEDRGSPWRRAWSGHEATACQSHGRARLRAGRSAAISKSSF